MKISISKFLLTATLGVSLLFSANLVQGQVNGDYQSIVAAFSGGNWSTTTSWQKRVGGAWVASPDYPGQVNIPGNTVTINGLVTVMTLDVSPAFAIGNLSIGGLGTTLTTGAFNTSLSMSTSASVSAFNTITFNGTGNLTVSGPFAVAGTFTDGNDTGITTLVGVVTVGGTFNTTSVTTSSNLIFRGGISNTGTFTAGGATFNTNAQSLSGGGNISFSQNVVITGITLTSLNAGNLTISGTTTGTGSFTNSNNTGVDTFVGNVNLAGAFNSTAVAASANLIFRGGIVSSGTSFAAGGATFNTNAQAISGTTATSFANNVVITGIVLTYSNTNNLTVTGTTSGTGGFTDSNNAGIDTFTGNVALTGAWTSTAVTTSGNLIFQGGITNSGTSFTAGGATFDTNAQAFSGTTAASFANNVVITGILVTYSNTNNLTVTGTTTGTGSFTDSSNSGIDTFTGNVALTGTWTTTSVTTSANLIFQGGIGSSGTSFAAGGATFNTNPQSITGTTATSFANNVVITGILLTYSNTSDLTVTGTTTGTGGFTDSSNSGIDTFTGNVALTGAWTTTAVTASTNLIFQGGITNSGASFSGGGATFNTNAQAISGTTVTSFANNVVITTILLTYSNTNNLTITGTTTGTGGFTDSANAGIDTFTGNVALTGAWTSTTVTTSANLIFQGGINSSGTSFTAGGATFNTASQSISGSTAVSFANQVFVTGGGIVVSNDNTASVTMSNTAGAILQGTGGWSQGTTINTLNYAGATIAITVFNASGVNNTVNYTSAAGAQAIFASTYHHLILSGAGNQTKTLGAATIVNGDLSILNTAIFSLGAFDLQVKGNWVNSSTNADPLVQGGQTVTFNGTTPQAINNTGNANGTVFNNVTLTNSTGFTLNNASVVVQSTLTFTPGSASVVNLNALNLTIGTAAATPGALVHSQLSTAGWVYGGNLIRFVNTGTIAGGSVVGFFPMGNATNFRPFAISCPATGITTGGSFTVSHSAATNTIIIPPPGVGIADLLPAANIILQHQASWSVSSAGVVGGTYNLVAGGTGFGTIAALLDLRLCKSASVVGSNLLATGTTADPRLNRTGLTLLEITTTGGSQFFVGSTDAVNTPLPISLVSFLAQVKSDFVELNWRTESELNNDFFLIQRTSDAETFEDIVKVKGAGTSTASNSYAAFDHRPLPGKSYYRLKQTDFDGNSSYSKLVSVEVSERLTWSVYPNPSDGSGFNIKFTEKDLGKNAFVKLHDLGGKEILQVNLSNLTATQMKISTPQNLSPGIYFISIAVDQEVVRQKVVIR